MAHLLHLSIRCQLLLHSDSTGSSGSVSSLFENLDLSSDGIVGLLSLCSFSCNIFPSCLSLSLDLSLD